MHIASRAAESNSAGLQRGFCPASETGAAAIVLFVRHGRTHTTGSVLPGRAPGLHLSSVGEAQARRIAERIATLAQVTAVYSSPMERTLETAEVIARACRLSVVEDHELTECDFGRWTGLELDDLRQREEWVVVQRNPSAFRFPDGESFTEIQARSTNAVTGIAARHPGACAVVVSHADVIKTVVASAMGVPLDLFQRIVISPCSVTVIRYALDGPSVFAVNSAGSNLAELITA